MTDINKFLEKVWGKQSVNQKKINVKFSKLPSPALIQEFSISHNVNLGLG